MMCSNSDFFIARNLMAQYPEYSENYKKKVKEGKANVKDINKEFLLYLFNERNIKYYGSKII